MRAVLVSAPRYRQLVADLAAREAPGLDLLAARFEALYASMQTADVRAATARALRARPEEMGQAAVASAREAAPKDSRHAQDVPASE